MRNAFSALPLLCLIFCVLTTSAQKDFDITGVWTGEIFNDSTQKYIPFELAVSHRNGEFSGYTYTVFVIDSIENIGVKEVTVTETRKGFVLKDKKLIDNNYTDKPARGVYTTLELQHTQNDEFDILDGRWYTNKTKQFYPLSGTVHLTKRRQIFETRIMQKLSALGLANRLSFVNPSQRMTAPSVASNVKPGDAAETSTPAQATNSASKPAAQPSTTKSEPKEDGKQLPAAAESSIPQTGSTARTIHNVAENVKTHAADVRQPAPARREVTVQSDMTAADKLKAEGGAPAPVPEAATRKPEVASANAAGAQAPKPNAPVTKSTAAAESLLTDKAVAPEARATVAVADPSRQTTPPDRQILPEHVIDHKNAHSSSESEANKIVAATSGAANHTPRPATGVSVDTTKALAAKGRSFAIETTSGANKTPGLHEVTSRDVAVSPPVKDLSTRKIETIQAVQIDNDSIVFSLYDNGVIDGDTVSVLLNGKTIVSRIGLLATAYNHTVHLTPEMGDSIKIILYAENLGSIPPNTGLLVVRDGRKNHEIRFSGDLRNNSAIILLRNRKE